MATIGEGLTPLMARHRRSTSDAGPGIQTSCVDCTRFASVSGVLRRALRFNPHSFTAGAPVQSNRLFSLPAAEAASRTLVNHGAPRPPS